MNTRRRPILLAAALGACIAVVPVGISAADTRSVRVGDNFFSPSRITIDRGDSIRFRFVGDAGHNVTRRSGPSFTRVGTRRSGRVTRRFSRRGTYRLYCTVHGYSDQNVRVRVE